MVAKLKAVQAADPYALAHGYLFASDGQGKKVDEQTATAWLHLPDKEDGEFIWLHFHDICTVLEGWPLDYLELPEEFSEALKGGSRSTHIEHVDHSLIAIVNDVDYDFERKKPLEVATLWLNVGEHYLLSVRSLSLRSVNQVRQAVETGKRFHSPLALLVNLLQEQADVLFGIVHNAALAANTAEDSLLSDKLPKRASLGGIRRDLLRLRRLLAPEPAALFRLISQPPTWAREEDIQDLRQSAEEFSLALRDMVDLQERIKLLEEEIADRVSEHTNRSVFILTAATVVALPINLIAGLWGMNVGGIPLRTSREGFWLLVVLALLLTCVAAWVIFRRRDD
ncbi:magnesium transporter CorA [Neisseriaceae bacterium JH1-16]|nr:magnesium transporter CorA [Neisseriaceae bacterium JH1-16]